MKRSELQLLLIAIGVLLAFASWQFVYKPFQEKTAVIEAENDTLQARVDQLELLNAKKPQYEADTEQMKADCTAIINKFPSGVYAEDIIMYFNEMELVDANDMVVPAASMGTPDRVPYNGVLEVSNYTLADDGITMDKIQSTLTYTTTYNGLKNLLSYIYGISTRKSVSSVNVTAAADGFLNGTVLVDFYYLNGTEFPYVQKDIMGVPLGTSNLFGVRTGETNSSGGGSEEGSEEAGEEGEEAEAEE
ncbi:MAG: hypothetical protein NC318_02240 [Blautia sp.]|nr:hypothetical protein [Lachnoclostridium sp.]MCM1210400.1 hypothetical protein [Blautia sp.]